MILCGTDLSTSSESAVRAAAALAKKQSRELLLATVLERDDASARRSADVRLEQDAGELRRDFDIPVETCVVTGNPAERLLELGQARNASVLVVGAEGASRHARRLGSVPEALCHSARMPVLVARSAEGLVDWSRNARPLNVLLGSGLGDSSTSALSQIGAWPDVALTIAHVAWPYGEHYRLGVHGPMPLDHLRPEVHHQLIGDLGRWASQVPCSGAPKLKVIPGWGRIDSHLAQLAQERSADLLVVGSHRRNLAARVWHGSVSRNAIHEADCSVLCVPQEQASVRIPDSPRTAVVPTDFSTLADRAIGYAYSLLQPGATLHLVHVSADPEPAERQAQLAKLKARIPQSAIDRGITTETHVLDGSAAWLAIWQHASRVSADVICMATHSRDAAGSLLLGSQALALLQHSRKPVVLVPPDREA